MCGLAGYLDPRGVSEHVVGQMALRIRHRGPDDVGVWVNGAAGVALAHQRLAILDLSPAGHQPMHSPCKRFTLIFNGEIYNHLDLRVELEEEAGNFDWSGHSDTETLLAALRHWGVEAALPRLRGMFAFALWDDSERALYLARDRMGEKPLFYGRNGTTFLFGSELKGLLAHPHWKGEIDRDALALYLRHHYVPCPWSIFKGINKLPPAHFVVIRDGGQTVSEPQCYWDLLEIAERGCANQKADETASRDELERLLLDAVHGCMASDVPLGAFLSGGLDSTTVVALMQAQSDRPVKTFTIGFHEEGYNEAVHARNVARHLGTDHTELYVTPDEALSVIPRLPTIWDEPFADSSQIPTVLVSELARTQVTVSLSGDGGDELFYGYQRYAKGQDIWKKIDRLPLSLRKILARGVERVSAEILEGSLGRLRGRMRLEKSADRLQKISEFITAESGEALYRQLVSHWRSPESLVYGSTEPATLFAEEQRLSRLPDLPRRMMYLDSMTYLPDDILTKVDRASMAVSLEARVPLLDHRVVEFAWQLPMEMKYRGGQGKWLLREVLYRHVPREMVERPKMGFGVPIDEWLRGPLREWGEQMLSEDRLRREGFLDPAPIRKKWDEHVKGKRSWHYLLWDVLMFQAWLEASG